MDNDEKIETSANTNIVLKKLKVWIYVMFVKIRRQELTSVHTAMNMYTLSVQKPMRMKDLANKMTNLTENNILSQ